ncbi:MAG TPA: hypothetical protein VLJ10_04085 [Candidatus Bathyarchaeia archaeon]|nr:hypothetical protein [Candidatus Bathyarchaeia archaeon]
MINKRYQMVSVVIVVFCLAAVTLLGCSPAMRKKFVREKKKAHVDDAVIPVLEPEDYPNELETSKTRYDYFYALLKVWHKDALTVLEDNPSDKQMVYVFNQMVLQLEELSKLFTGTTAEKVAAGLTEVRGLMTEYEKPVQFRNQDVIRKKIQRLRERVIEPLSEESVKDDLKG